MKPGTISALNFSNPNKIENIHTESMRSKSTVDLWAAEAYFVIDIPK